MRDEPQKLRDRLYGLDLTSWLPASAILFLIFGCLLALHTTVRKEREVVGTVVSATWRTNGDTGQRYSDIQVALDNKSQVRAGSIATALPEVGSRVRLRKRAMLLGYTTYQWDGPPPSSRAASTIPTPAALPVSIP